MERVEMATLISHLLGANPPIASDWADYVVFPIV